SHAFPGVGFCLGEGQEIDWIGHTEYSETRIEQLDHIFNLIGINLRQQVESAAKKQGPAGPCLC
ncbi:hypothetical protein ACEUAO_21015, partial [Aeromonas caviae]|uniref:hypothetical protein n=1 Tax=Aeromonas caviae TaxID=648 RepID=UPI0038D1E6DB